MRIITHVAMFFYLAIISLVATAAIAFALHLVRLEDIIYYLGVIYGNKNFCLILAAVSVGVVLLSLFLSRIILGVQRKERTIAFDNPNGRVSISLAALEDMIKRSVLRISDVKEIKAGIRVTKKGIDVTGRLILKSEINIPDATSRIQDLIKGRIQEILGLEENVNVKLHISKIFSQADKERPSLDDASRDAPELSVPFKGYRK